MARGAAHGAFPTPWRTIQIADSAGGLVESNLILNLNEPNKLGDVCWFKPFKYVGVWWALHLDKETWAPGPKHGATTANAKRYIDFAASTASAACWSRAGTRAGTATGSPTAATSTSPSPTPISTSKRSPPTRAKGVHLIGHHETAGDVGHYEAQLEAALDLYQRLGIDASRPATSPMPAASARSDDGRQGPLRVARRPVHGAPPPEGRDRGGEAPHRDQPARADQGHRPAPHLSELGRARRRARHGVQRLGQAAESARARGQPGLHAHARRADGLHARHPTPEGPRRQPIQTTLAKQLALYVVLYSPIQMAADLPENYEQHADRSSSSRTCRPTGPTRACSTARSATT